jgi:hypothetical protein
MAKNKKANLKKISDGGDILDDDVLTDIDENDFLIDDDSIEVDINTEDDEDDTLMLDRVDDNTNHINIASDIKVVQCINCKEDVLEADLCPICGKPLKKSSKTKKVSDIQNTEKNQLQDGDFFVEEDAYISEISNKIDDDEYYEN